MKNINNTFVYLYKHFFTVCLFTIIPAVFMGSFFHTSGVSSFIANYSGTAIASMGDMWNLLFSWSWQSVLFLVLGSLLMVICVSVYLGNVEYHFRVGKMNLKNIWSYLNNNALALALYCVLFFVLFIVYKMLLTVLLFAVHVLFSGLNTEPNLFTFIFSCVSICGTFVLMIFAFNYFLLALPVTLSNGYNVRTSFAEASELLLKKQTMTALGTLLPITISFLLFLLARVFDLGGILNIIGIWLQLMYLPVYSFVCYYDYAFLKRYDNRGKYYFK